MDTRDETVTENTCRPGCCVKPDVNGSTVRVCHDCEKRIKTKGAVRSELVPGDVVFRWVDQEGIPLAAIRAQLRQYRQAFDVVGFLRAAQASGNYNRQKALRCLLEDLDDGFDGSKEAYKQCVDLVNLAVTHVYGS